MPGANWAYATGTADDTVVIPPGQRIYLVSIVTGGSAASFRVGPYSLITVPAMTSMTLTAESFPNEYVGPTEVEIAGTPSSWVIAWGDPDTIRANNRADMGCY